MDDWQTLSTAVNSLMNNATEKMEALTASATLLTEGSGADTLVAMRETTSWSNRLTEQYIAQAAIAASMVGDEGGSSCSRSPDGTYQGHFSIGVASDNSSQPGTQRRKMLSASDRSNAIAQTLSWESWGGYFIGASSEDTNAGGWALEAEGMDTPERARWVGGSGRNRLVGGLFLHTTRNPAQVTCSTHSKWAMGCSKSVIPLAEKSSRNALVAFLKQLFAGAGNSAYPYGVDPVFLRSSSLYTPDLVGCEDQWYNVSDPAEVPPATGVPYGYYHRALTVSPPLEAYMQGPVRTFLVLVVLRNCSHIILP